MPRELKQQKMVAVEVGTKWRRPALTVRVQLEQQRRRRTLGPIDRRQQRHRRPAPLKIHIATSARASLDPF